MFNGAALDGIDDFVGDGEYGVVCESDHDGFIFAVGIETFCCEGGVDNR